MAIIMDQFGRKKDTEADSSTPAAASSGQPGPAAPVGQKAQTKGSGQFTDLNKYLTANKGVGNMAGGIRDRALGAGPQTEFTVKTQAAGPSQVDLNDNSQVEAGVGYLGSTFDQNKYNDQVSGDAVAQYQRANQQRQQADKLANNDYGTIKAASGLNSARQGLANLTTFGLQRDPNTAQTFKGAQGIADQNYQNLEAGVQKARGQIQADADKFKAGQASLRDYLTGANKGITNQLEEAKKAEKDRRWQEAYTKAEDELRGTNFSDLFVKNNMGGSNQQKFSKKDVEDYMNQRFDLGEVSSADVANDSQRAQLAALQKFKDLAGLSLPDLGGAGRGVTEKGGGKDTTLAEYMKGKQAAAAKTNPLDVQQGTITPTGWTPFSGIAGSGVDQANEEKPLTPKITTPKPKAAVAQAAPKKGSGSGGTKQTNRYLA